ncbi:hypothetical protein DL96DRAFT_1635823 [Flagelloscypha sp. PMI_526]|nr:hypothetical protein DL96DRAFT_1635823 [Flagelloscypha sp. PMI_526]
MSPDLPPEIWTKILASLPLASLHQVRHINHAVYTVCSEHLFRDLVLVSVFTEQNVEHQLHVLRNRLNVAKLHPTLIKSIRFMPRMIIPDFFTWMPPAQKKSFQFLRRLFQKPEEDSSTWLIRHPTPKDTSDIDQGLASLISSLTSLEELQMEDSWYGGWSPTAGLALNVTAARLTVLLCNLGPPLDFLIYYLPTRIQSQ